MKTFEMTDDYGYPKFDDSQFPLAYLLTFRTYGTWLHGDERLSVNRDGRNIYGTSRIGANERLEKWMSEEMKDPPFLLTEAMRSVVDEAVVELCHRRDYVLKASNIRTNHGHVVLSAAAKPERIADAIKAEATKMLRLKGLISQDARVWSRGRSRRYLWKPRHVEAAIEYTLYGQGDFELPD